MARIYLDNSYYFFTCPTFLHNPCFNSFQKKKIILDRLKELKEKSGFLISAFSIVPDHYHLLFHLNYGKDLFKTARLLNGGISFQLNQLEKSQRRIWGNYWSRIISGEEMFFKILGYIIGNPLKHRMVTNFEELGNYRFCSYYQTVKKYGKEFTQSLVLNVKALDLENNTDFDKIFSDGIAH